MDQNYFNVVDISDILFGSFIKYDRMYEMTKFAFYGKTDSNDINVYIDAYSILRNLYSKGPSLRINDSYVIASCLINLAIHIRAYFESRHRVASKIYIIYGGARPLEAIVNWCQYNRKNIIKEDSDIRIKELILDNLEVVKLLTQYLYDIFCIVDYRNEFSIIASSLIDKDASSNPNIVYSKEALAYQLVAFKPKTFLYRPKKKMNIDSSWVVTKSTIYDAYRYGELQLKKQIATDLNYNLFSIYQAITGVRTRGMNSLKDASSTIKLLSDAVNTNAFPTGYNANAIFASNINPFEVLFKDSNIDPLEVEYRFGAIDLLYQTSLYKNSLSYREIEKSLVNLYDPETVKMINNKYFEKYPLDLNRV